MWKNPAPAGWKNPTFVADLMLQFLGKRCDHLGQTRHSESLPGETLGGPALGFDLEKKTGEMMVKWIFIPPKLMEKPRV